MKPTGEITAKLLLESVEERYHGELEKEEPEDNATVMDLYNTWLHGPDSKEVEKVLYTQYHEVAKLDTKINTDW